MCITSETCRAKSVIKKLALNNLHQAGPSKPIPCICFLHWDFLMYWAYPRVWNHEGSGSKVIISKVDVSFMAWLELLWHPERIWGPWQVPEAFFPAQLSLNMKRNTHFHSMLRSKMHEPCSHTNISPATCQSRCNCILYSVIFVLLYPTKSSLLLTCIFYSVRKWTVLQMWWEKHHK